MGEWFVVDLTRALSFRLADAFPPDDSVGEFLVSLAVAANDIAFYSKVLTLMVLADD